jgi:hypothetical protein
MNVIHTKAYSPSRVSGTHVGYLMAHQASKSWTPDEDRMSGAVLNRLAEAHGVMTRQDMCPITRAQYYCLCKRSLEEGCLLVSFSS